tara:strand:+ start:229 stop:627 length:399 start_codon:yes stop_codon:yes gene_type:complete
MKTQRNRNKTRKSLRKTKYKYNKIKSKSKKFIRNRKVKQHKKLKTRKKKSRKNMKGGAIPFSELNPSTVLEHVLHGAGSASSGLVDSAQLVPNSVSFSPSVLDQPHLDGGASSGLLNVAGGSPDVHFANTTN